MRIKEIKSQSRRDFTAVYECENCGREHTAPVDSYRALGTKYADGVQV